MILVLSCISVVANAQLNTYNIDPLHTSVNWSVGHYNFSIVSGKFIYISGNVKFDLRDISESSVKLTIPIKNITTGISKLDKVLLSSDFFAVQKYPTAKFVSTNIIDKGKGKFNLEGNLTLHGITRPVLLKARFNGSGLNFEKVPTIGFSAKTVIDRTKYGIDKYPSTLGKEIKLNIQLEANLKKPEVNKEIVSE